MLSYQHIYHAGGPADVHKHAALSLLLERLAAKAKPFSVIDLYAGEGRYDLTAEAAQKTKEYAHGVGRLWPMSDHPPALQRYCDVLNDLNADGALRTYPGSPEVIRALMRAEDHLTLNELHPAAYRTLRHWRSDDSRISIHKRNGLEALVGLVPPAIRRGLVFIDPSYEVKSEYADIAAKIARATAKWPQGIYALWYPILTEGRHRTMIESASTQVDASIFKTEIMLTRPKDGNADGPVGLLGSGLLIFNPPWQFDIAMSEVGLWLAKTLTDGDGRHTSAWLKRTKD